MKKSGILKCVRPDTWRPKAQQNLPSWTNNGNGSARGQLDTALSAWGEPRKGGCHVCSLPKRRQKQVLPVLQPFHDQPRHFSTCAGRTMPETPWQTPDATTEDAAAPGGPRCGPTQDAIHRGATRGPTPGLIPVRSRGACEAHCTSQRATGTGAQGCPCAGGRWAHPGPRALSKARACHERAEFPLNENKSHWLWDRGGPTGHLPRTQAGRVTCAQTQCVPSKQTMAALPRKGEPTAGAACRRLSPEVAEDGTWQTPPGTLSWLCTGGALRTTEESTWLSKPSLLLWRRK